MGKESGIKVDQENSILASRVKRTRDFMSMFTRNPKSIPSALQDILYPKSLFPEESPFPYGGTNVAQTTEDAAIALCYVLQANIMHRNMTPVPANLSRVVETFIPKDTITKKDLVLWRLGQLTGLPSLSTPDTSATVSFSDPKDTAVFLVASELTRREKGASRIIFLEPKTKEWEETQHLMQRVNKYMPPERQLSLKPLQEAPWINKNEKGEDDALHGFIHNIENIAKKDKLRKQKQARYDRRRGEDGISVNTLANVLRESSQHAVFDPHTLTYEMDEHYKPLPKIKQKHSEFYGEEKVPYQKAVPFLSFLLHKSNGDPQKVARWYKTNGKYERVFGNVEKSLFTTIESATNKERAKRFSDALADDILEGDIYFRKLRQTIKLEYLKIRGKQNRKAGLSELDNLPITSIVGKMVILHNLETLAVEIGERIRTRRNAFRTEGSDRDDFNLEAKEKELRSQGLNVLYNEPIHAEELNVRPSKEYVQEASDLLDLVEPARNDGDGYTATPQSLYQRCSPESLLKLLVYATIERNTHHADTQDPWVGRKVPVHELIKLIDGEKVRDKEYEPYVSKFIDPKQPDIRFLTSDTRTGISAPVTFGHSTRSNGVDIRYFGHLIGSLDTIEGENRVAK